MKSVKSNILLFTLMLAFSLTQGQSVNQKFDKLSISENFDSINTHWTTLANAENLFIVQDGEYILQRKAPTAPYAIIANFDEQYGNFRMITSMKLEKTFSEDATMGVLFMMQEEGQGGFLCEINKMNQYRIRQIVNGTYRYLTGIAKDGGWVKSNAINEANNFNLVEIRSFKGKYDLLINNVFIQSFTESTYKSGRMGLIIGPGSRGKVDFMYVFTVSENSESNAVSPEDGNNQQTAIKSSEPDIIDLAESIIKLKTQINKLTEENDDLQKTISAMRSDDQEKEVNLKNNDKMVKSLQTQVKQKDATIDSLKKVNTDLLKFKEMVGGNENADIVITLSKALKSEKEKSAGLEKENAEMREKLGLPKTNGPKSNPKSGQTPPAKKDTNIISLPKED